MDGCKPYIAEKLMCFAQWIMDQYFIVNNTYNPDVVRLSAGELVEEYLEHNESIGGINGRKKKR